ncbi:MAG: hypothetical protein Q8M95_14260 [Candidatus Methanoperedens sp.]|nr:hypothetical protein [Candidatus Methanoperedens sp.]
MDEYTLYKYVEFLMISLYLIFIFLSVQMCLIWIDVDKHELNSKISANDSILKNSIITVFFIGAFLIIHKFVEGTEQPNLFFKIFELFGFICVVFFIYKWHMTLKSCAHKKKPASDFLHDACLSGIVDVEPSTPFPGFRKKMNFMLLFVSGIAGVLLVFFVPLSTIYFAIIAEASPGSKRTVRALDA